MHGSTVGSQSAAVRPWYVGWVQVRPLSNEKLTADRPTPRLNVPSGNEHAPAVVDAALEHGCMSTRSLAPEASTVGREASTANEGSFWVFCGCRPVGLPTLTK